MSDGSNPSPSHPSILSGSQEPGVRSRVLERGLGQNPASSFQCHPFPAQRLAHPLPLLTPAIAKVASSRRGATQERASTGLERQHLHL